MAKEPSVYFIKSIAKFKKSFNRKKTGLANHKTRLKMIDDFLITKRELESGNYDSILRQEGNEELKKQIQHRIVRYQIFLDTLPETILVPKELYDTFSDKTDLYRYFISSQRKNVVVNKMVQSPLEIELAIAGKIIDNFYDTDKAGLDENKKYVVIQKMNLKKDTQ